ncbi:LOW QUALITY PROTEIN: Glyceraldehyde-3-phosphate dehydrogenase [Plecturocebus cupreus]
MVKVKARVSGFGHIGCLITKAAFNSGKVDIVTINDPFIDLNYMAENGKLVISGNPITIFQEQDPSKIRWGNTGTDVVRWRLHHHGEGWDSLAGKKQRFIISAPSADAPMFMMAANHKKYDNSLKIVSNASCTTNCLPPLTKAMTTLKTVDGPSRKLWCDSIRALQNIIPASTGTAKAVGKVIPELNRKLTGMAFHVLTVYVSVMDLSCHLETAAKYDIKKVVKQATEAPSRAPWAILSTRLSPPTLTDIHSSTFNAGAGIALNTYFAKFIAW